MTTFNQHTRERTRKQRKWKWQWQHLQPSCLSPRFPFLAASLPPSPPIPFL